MKTRKSSPILVLTTVSKKSDAAKISKLLVEAKLAACVTTLPAGESCYRWNGKLCVEKEFVLFIKTTSKAYSNLENKLKSIHPYECPEILGIPIEKISKSYATWLLSNVM
jgi:periplasmic divalent cation tolerance protein